MNGTRLLPVLLFLSSYGAAQSTTGAAEIEQLQVKREGADVKIEVILTGAVKPSVETAINPDRLVLTLPGTVSDAKQKHFPLNANGVHGVRVGLNSANPPVTRVVVDMDSVHPYTVSAEGNSIILRVQSAETDTATAKRSGPVPAASAPLVSVFRRRPQAQTTDSSNAQTPIPVAPKLPPINFPEKQAASTQASASPSAATTAPSATHPKLGSLQQGTVFPGMGTPGAGTVPSTQNQGAAVQSAGAAPASTPLTVTVTQGSSGLPGAPVATSAPNTSAVASTTAGTAAPAVAIKPVVATAPASPSIPPAATPATSAQPGSQAGAAPASASASVAPVVGTTGPTTSSTGAPNVTSKVLSATVTTPAPNVPVAPAPAKPGTPATVPSSSGPQPVTASTIPATTPGSTAQAALPTTSSTPSPTSTTPGTNAADVSADATVVAKEVEPEMPAALALRATHPDFRTTFRIKYVASGVAYLDGGRSAGLTEGMKLVVRDTPTRSVVAAADGDGDNVVAELEVVSVAESSAVTDVHTPKRDMKSGDLAYLSSQDEQALVQENTLSATRKYPTVISFTDSDALDEEARAEVPRPPMPSINRARGRLGIDYMGTSFQGATGGTNSDLGLVARIDMTRIGGTYWNASGYWRGRLNSSSYSGGGTTLQDLINRTYHLSMIYDNPSSPWVAGFGRMYLPWAPSLDTIDGGYFGRRLGHAATMGVFAGSTPDPTSWTYNPNQRIGGLFVNFEGGSFDSFRYSSTSGAAISTVDWKITRPFVFFENGLYYKRYVSIYDSLQADSPVGYTAGGSPGPGLSRNFLTVRFQPHERIEFDANYNYFRDIPTFDVALIGTTLLDKYLFQGFSGGVRLEVLKQVWLYTDLGRSNRSGDTTSSLNQLYGITFGRLPWVHIRADGHYSRFNSSFGSGYYESVSLSRSLRDNFRLELLGGRQNFTSSFTANDNSRFITSNLEMNMGLHYFVQGGFTVSRGVVQNYDQWLFTLGYRFDTRSRAKAQ
jgi:hypothetical protein